MLLRDGRKLFGFWIAIAATMASLAALDRLGWGALNPKPFTWLNGLLGGVCFGFQFYFKVIQIASQFRHLLFVRIIIAKKSV